MTNTGIYQLKCDDCDAIYTRIGQTGRCLQHRVKEHRVSILKNHKPTGFAEHCIENNYFFNGKDVGLFYYVNKGKVMDYLEILSIKKSLEN